MILTALCLLFVTLVNMPPAAPRLTEGIERSSSPYVRTFVSPSVDQIEGFRPR